MTELVQTTDLVILVYFLALNSFYALLLVLSVPEIWEQTRLAEDDDFQRLMQSDALPPITILVPAHNEQATIEASVTAILTLECGTPSTCTRSRAPTPRRSPRGRCARCTAPGRGPVSS